jgi:ABC-type transport system involved in Fe-S cluster assembly fused permease/ATPase subunit
MVSKFAFEFNLCRYTEYRETRQSLIDMTQMFDLLDQKPDIVDKLGAPALVVPPQGLDIEFKDVHFGYAGRVVAFHRVNVQSKQQLMTASVLHVTELTPRE